MVYLKCIWLVYVSITLCLTGVCIVGISKLGVITCMAKRSKVNKNKSKKLFSKTADRTKGLNLRAVPMRGGFRI